MEKELISMLMVINIKVNGLMIKNKDMVFLLGKMGINLKGNFIMI